MAIRWTNEDEDTLRCMFIEGNTDQEIGIAINRSAYSIADKRRKLGLLRDSSKYTEDDRAVIRNMVEEGKSNQEIAVRLGRTKAAIALQCNKNMGLTGIRSTATRTSKDTPEPIKGVKRTTYTQEEDTIIEELYTAGCKDAEIAAAVGRTTAALRSYRVSRSLVYINKTYTKEELIEALEKSPDKRRSYFIINADKLPPISQYTKVWGTWTNVLESNGYALHSCTLQPDKETILYVLDFGYFYKVGITQNSTQGRFLSSGLKFSSILEYRTTLDNAKSLERRLLAYFSPTRYEPDELRNNGATECFKSNHSEVQKAISIFIHKQL